MSNIITSLDMGSSKIAAAQAVIRKDASFSIIGLEYLNSHGISKGEITDIDKAASDIASIAKRLQKQTGRKIKHIHVATKA